MSEETNPAETIPTDASPEMTELRAHLSQVTAHAGLMEANWHAEKALRENMAVGQRALEEALRAATADLQRARTKLGAYTEHIGKLITIVENAALGDEADEAAKAAFAALGEP